MRRFIASLAFLCFLLVACAADSGDDSTCEVVPHPSTVPNQTIRVYKMMIHSAVPGSKVGPIIDAASEWTTVTDGKFVFEVVYADFDTAAQPDVGEMRVYLAPKSDPKSNVIGTAWWWGADANGRPVRSRIWIADNLPDRVHYLTAMHEIGHALGLGHSESNTSVMYPTITDNGDHVPCIDQKSICQIWACTPDCQ